MIPSDDHVLDYVDAYLHDVLTKRDKEQVAAHCQACTICRVALDEARKRLEALQSLPPIEAPDALIQATLERVQRHRSTRGRWAVAGLLAAAAAVLLLATAHVYYSNLAPSPYDLRVLGQSELLAGSDASLRVLLVDPRNAEPWTGVPVQIEMVRSEPQAVVHLASFTTDQFGSGTVRMHVPDWTPGKYKLRVSAQPGRQTESIEQTVTLRRSWHLMLTNDKPVYQPGEVIRLRSLALARPQSKPVAGQEAVFSVTDPKGNMIFRQREVTSRFGIASADCPLAGEILEGPYQVRCELGDATSSLTVEVKKYVLPKFKIALELDEPYYQPGQKVRGTLSARYFFGKPVDRAEVEIEVRAADVTPEKIAQTTVQTDSSGMARFEFIVPRSLVGRPQDSGDARISVNATVRDSGGQKQSASVSRVVTQQPIRIEVIPEAGSLVRGLANTVYILASYADGRPAPARIALSGFHEEIKTNAMGAASVEFTPEDDAVRWVVRATDEAGRSGRREVELHCGSPNEQFLVRTDKAVYDGGQTIHVLALGGGNEPLMLDLIRDGQTMLTDVIAMRDGRGEYQVDLAPEVSGTLQLCAYRYGREGLPVLQSRVIYVRQARGLNVSAQLDRPEYRPGEQAKLTLSLADARGKPVPGALSLAAVDEAVYSVLGPAPGMQSVFSALEQEILKPVYAIYPWSPDMAIRLPAEERDRFEKALFAAAGTGRINRNAILDQAIRQFAEGDRRLLDVLERPDWELLAEGVGSLKEHIPLLKGQRPLHTLRESTYPEKLRQIDHIRQERLREIIGLWIILGIVAGLAVVIAIAASGRFIDVLAILVIVGILMALLMPAVQSARESGRRASAINDLRELGLALTLADDSRSLTVPDVTLAPVRVREWFPETLLWRPELITDDNGRATLTVDLADSITTWRLSASAVSGEGQLGGMELPIRVFQPFFVDLNLPVNLTRGDEVAVPAVVYNYLDKPLEVELRMADAPWFERLGSPAQKLKLAAGEVRSVSYRLRARQPGRHELTVHAMGAGVADAIKRTVEVVPDGRRVEHSASGTLQQPADIAWSVPEEAIEGSVRANIKLYPSTFSQLVEGLDAIFQRPYGCFEQTSSTTYPNVLALDYLWRTKKSVPAVEAKARQYIHLGYQRLLGFEVAGGGFDWFGRGPANRTLTAYGLMEFSDMARVHDVDPKVIDRTRTWLLAQQAVDGSWAPDGHHLHNDPTGRRTDLQRVGATAYIAWSVFGRGGADSAGTRAMAANSAFQYLLSRDPAAIDDPYTLALVANALLAIRPGDPQIRPYLQRIEASCRRSADGKLAWWDAEGDRRTVFHGAGQSGRIETTALAALALIEGQANPAAVRAALAWLVAQKDAHGTWHSTQATVLALKALLAGTDRPLAEAQQRQIDFALDGKTVNTLVIPADQAEVTHQVELSGQVARGSHRLAITDRTGTATGYQATLVYHVPGADGPLAGEPLSIRLDYDKTTLVVDDRVAATATVTNRQAAAAPMVILDLPIPAGFAVEAEDFEALQSQGKIAKFQLTPRSVVAYLRELGPSEPLVLTYHLRATMPVKITAPAARVYEYYNPSRQAQTAPTPVTVAAAK